jgi:hypothetical protein
MKHFLFFPSSSSFALESADKIPQTSQNIKPTSLSLHHLVLVNQTHKRGSNTFRTPTKLLTNL